MSLTQKLSDEYYVAHVNLPLQQSPHKFEYGVWAKTKSFSWIVDQIIDDKNIHVLSLVPDDS